MKLSRRLAPALLALFLCAFSASLFAHTYSSQQLIPANHWIYDALYTLGMDSGRTFLADSAPLSVGELKLYFDEINYERLSPSGKKLYGEAQEFFDEKKFALELGPVTVGFNIIAEPQLMFKSNDDIDWTFGTDYTGHTNDASGYKSKFAENYEYGAGSSFLASSASAPFVSLPLVASFADLVVIESDFFLGKSFWGMTDDNNFTNLMYTPGDFEFNWPRYAYGTIGKTFNNWGVNLSVGHEGMQIGRTATGSILYNSTFETDAFVQLNLYSPYVKYSMSTVQIERERYLYLHSIEFLPYIKWLRLSVFEGTLIAAPFELRFLNPLMIMHSFGFWDEYGSEDEKKYYGEAGACSYLGVHFDIVPCRNMRIYGLYAQNELQSPEEKSSANGRAKPDSFGIQLGMEFAFPEKNQGWWTCSLEGIYTSPFLYIKQGAEWSLWRGRSNMQRNGSNPIASWIGTPFGPDCIGAQLSVGYRQTRKWSVDFSYLFVAHGTNSFGLFGNYIEIKSKKYYTYYPAVRRNFESKLPKGENLPAGEKTPFLNDDEAGDIARALHLTGTVQYTNCLTLKGRYILNKHFSFGAEMTYTFIFNNKNKRGNFAHGVELLTSFTYTML